MFIITVMYGNTLPSQWISDCIKANSTKYYPIIVIEGQVPNVDVNNQL